MQSSFIKPDLGTTTIATAGSPLNQRLRHVWDVLTKPHPKVTGIAELRQARLISSFTIAVLLVAISIIFTGADFQTSGLVNPVLIFTIIGLVAFYTVSRTHYYQVALHGLLATMFAGVVVGALTNAGSLNALYYLVLPVLVANVLLTVRMSMVYAGIAVLSIVVAGHELVVRGVALQSEVTSLLMFNIGITVLLFVLMQYLRGVEQERQDQTLTALKRTEAANVELAKANAMARETTRLKSEFMATMSHELRTPLNAINGFCGIMLEGMGGEVDDEANHMIQRIELNGQRLLQLINEVLDLAKIEAGRLEIVNAPMDLQFLSNSWKAQMSVLAEKKNLHFDVSIDPALPTQVVGDQARITQIVTNLLSNAFKFTETGSVKLELQRHNNEWQIHVFDTGIGIPPHALNYIFEEFRQVDGSVSRAYGGSGLGLAIVRNLCRTMGGNIRVDSELGKGSHFVVTLPLLTAEASAVEATAEQSIIAA